MDRGERGECEHQPQDRHENVEGQSDRKEHHALGPFHESAADRETERLGLGPLVRDQHGERQHAQREHRELGVLAGQMPGDPTQQGGVGESVTD